MVASWRTLLSIFLTHFLLICCNSNEQTSPCTPSVSMDELGRATVDAAGVFEGRLEVLGYPTDLAAASSASLSRGGHVDARFLFRRLHKGRFNRVSRAEARAEVVVRLHLTGDTRTLRTDSVDGCSLSDLLVVRRNYLIFVGELANPIEQYGVVHFESSAFPVPLTKDAVKQIRAYRCRKCGQCSSAFNV